MPEKIDNKQLNQEQNKNTADPSAVKAPSKKKSFLDKIDFSAFKVYITILISFAVVVASVMALIIPQYREFGQINSRKSEMASQLKKIKSRADYLQSLYDDRAELEGNIEIATQAIPLSEDEIPFVLDQMIQIARSNNVEIESLSLGGSPSGDTPGKLVPIKMQMSVTGSYQNIIDYMHGIEGARRLVDMNNLNVSGGGEDPFNSNYKITTSLTGYYMQSPSLENLTIEEIINKPRLQDVLDKINELEYYDPQEIDIPIGRIDPFDEETQEIDEEATNANDDTKDVVEETENQPNGDGEETSSGITQ